MRSNRLSLSLLLALGGALTACGGTDTNLEDSQESLKRGQSADGGAVHDRRDHDRDSDEGAEESLSDGGRKHSVREAWEDLHGDGGCKFGFGHRGPRGHEGEDEGHDRGGDRDEDRGPRGDDHRGPGRDGKGEDGGHRGPRLPFDFDGGAP